MGLREKLATNIESEHEKVRNDEWSGVGIAPREVFRRFAEQAGHPIRFDAPGDTFIFVPAGDGKPGSPFSAD